MAKRTFQYDGKRRSVNVTTNLTDAKAIKLLGGFDGAGFQAECAFEINKMKNGHKAREGLVAWGFKIAHDLAHPVKPCVLSDALQRRVFYRKPLNQLSDDGYPFKVTQCGPRSKHHGKYQIGDGGEYPRAEFYGYADGETGEWKPTNSCPKSVIEALIGWSNN